MKRFWSLLPLLLAALLAACDMPVSEEEGMRPPPAALRMSPEQSARAFAEVVKAVEPVAEAECRARLKGRRCDFRILIDPNRNAPPNAFQGLDASGRPVITFTRTLIARAGSPDELAFVLSHETAHHILDHLARQHANARAGAAVFGSLATLNGGSSSDVANAQQLGAAMGARRYSREFELEADQLGTIIAYRAGYNPLLGAKFFNRIPDPGDSFLGTHPPNADRIRVVRQTSASLGLN